MLQLSACVRLYSIICVQCDWGSLSSIIDHWGDYGSVLAPWAGPGAYFCANKSHGTRFSSDAVRGLPDSTLRRPKPQASI